MKIIHKTPVLVSKTSHGEDKFWLGQILQENGRFYRQAVTWRTTSTGKKSKTITSDPYEIHSKNEGRANSTTAEMQALKEMEAIVRKQYDKGYTRPGEKSNILPLPMLAKKFSDRKDTLEYPVYIQPKYNGMRMLYDGKKGWSRGGKLILSQVRDHLRFDTEGHIMDGELILPSMPVLQETMSAVKKFHEGISNTLLYVVFDIIEPQKPFSVRQAILKNIIAKANNPKVIYAPTVLCEDESEVISNHKEFMASGFEGTIIRIDGPGYKIGHRSDQLLKLKDFQDAEFLITDVIDGEGKFKDSAIFVCQTKDGVGFFCTPEGSMEHRQELYKTRKQYVGKYLTIRYQELTNSGVPQFPIGENIREKGEF